MRALLPALLVTAILVACSSSSSDGTGGTAHCAVSPHGCRCQSDAFTLDSDETASPSCNREVGPVSAQWSATVSCCFDVDSDGETTSCDCLPWTCKDNVGYDECNCGYYASTVPASDRRSSCTLPAGDAVCCLKSAVEGDGDGCSCNAQTTDCSTRAQYEDSGKSDHCSSGTRSTRTCSGKHTATSCDGLRWKSPAPSGGGGGGSSSGDKPECTSDSTCSGKCSGDCYACRSGSCKCGYKGTSGSCIY